MAMSCFDRPAAALAVRAMNDGAKPRLTNANAPFLTNTRRDIMRGVSLESEIRNLKSEISPSLKLRRPQHERVDWLRSVNRRTAQLIAGESDGEVHAADQCPGVDPCVARVLVSSRRLAHIKRHAKLPHLAHERTGVLDIGTVRAQRPGGAREARLA